MSATVRRVSYSKLREQEQAPNSVVKDILLALDDAKWIGAVVALILGVCMFNILVQDGPQSILHTESMSLEVLRPVLSVDHQHHVKHARMTARTSVAIRPDTNTTYQHHRRATKRGHLPLPDLFYRGVVFGIAAHNSHGIPFMDTNFTDPLDKLREDIAGMLPQPTMLMDRYSFDNETGWDEPGFAAFFEYADLKKQGHLGNNIQPWEIAERKVMAIARKHKQVCIYRWHPHKWGDNSKYDNRKHTTIVQEVLPTRTGLNSIRSTTIVYLADDLEDNNDIGTR